MLTVIALSVTISLNIVGQINNYSLSAFLGAFNMRVSTIYRVGAEKEVRGD
ncbi:hypothetical protein P22_3939 [Propionispora sp. 2/2-37]|nr:hypothetical protein P22_3939 [Propionispora sp. 2/2-37]